MLRIPRYIQLILLLCCASAAVANTDFDESEKLAMYHQGIESISREINTAKQHRNAIITRMDEIGKKLGLVDLQSQDVVNREPTLLAGIEEIDQHIEKLAEKIADTQEAKKFIEAQLNAIPVPSLLEDILGQSVEKHRSKAVKKYQLHRTKSLLNTFSQEKQRLVDSKNSLFSSRQDIQGSITTLTADRDELVEKRKHLEARFANLTATIVQKQDRQDPTKGQTRRDHTKSTKGPFLHHARKSARPDKRRSATSLCRTKGKRLTQMGRISGRRTTRAGDQRRIRWYRGIRRPHPGPGQRGHH